MRNIFIFLLLVAIHCFSIENNFKSINDQAIDLIKNARDKISNSNTVSYLSKRKLHDDRYVETRRYTKKDPDGFMFSRTEVFYVPKQRSFDVPVRITNRTGEYEIYSSKVLKLNCFSNIAKKTAGFNFSEKDRFKKTLNYSISESLYKNQSVYLVTESMVDNEIDDYLETLSASLPEVLSFEQKKFLKEKKVKISDRVRQVTAVKTIFYISKKSGLIIKTEEFNKEGVRVGGVEYETIEIGMPLSHEIFEFSKAKKIKTINTMEDYSKEITNNK